MLTTQQKRTLFFRFLGSFLLLGSCWTAHSLFAQQRTFQPIQQPQAIQQPLQSSQMVPQPRTTQSPQMSPQMVPQPRTTQPRTPLPINSGTQTGTPNGTPTQATSPSLTLTQTSPAKLEQDLRQVCGHRFVAETQYQYAFSTNRPPGQAVDHAPGQTLAPPGQTESGTPSPSRHCSLRIDPQTNRVTFSGDRQLCDQVFQLIVAIDQPPQRGKERRVVPYLHAQPEAIAKILDAHRVPVPRNEIVINPVVPQHPVQQVTYQFQEGGLFEPGGINPIPRNDVPGLLQSADPTAIGIVPDVQWRFFPDLDALAVEADGPRLKQIVTMIRELEEISKTNRPKIEVVPLKHVNNVSLGRVIAEQTPQGGSIYTDIFRTVQGNVRILAMTTPNAMLLIGWGDQMETAKELIAALDLPIATENSWLHMFKLKHISANQARATLQGAFPPNVPPYSGFIARIQIFADQRSNTLIVQAAPNDLEQVKKILDEIDVPSSAPEVQMATINLKHSLAPDLALTISNAITAGTTDNKFPSIELLIQSSEGQRLVKSGILSDVNISTDVRQNIIIVRAPESCMAFIKELITLLDMASPEAEIKIFQIEHGDANSLVEMLTTLIPSNIAGDAGPRLPGTTEGESLIPIRFAVDVRSNSIVAAGSPGDLKTVEALVAAIDVEDQLSRKSTVYFLKNMNAEPVAMTISAFIENQLKIQAAASGAISPREQLETAVIVVPDTASNSLIINATPRYYDEIMKLIQEIDKSQPQVVIKVLIVEVTLSEDKEWAAELGLQDPLLFSRSAILGTSPPNNTSNGPGINFNKPGSSMANINTTNPVGQVGNVGSQILSNFAAGPVGAAGFGGMVFSASSDYLSIMLRALHEKKRLEVLSSPQILTINNQNSSIKVGQKVPRVTGTDMYQGQIRENIADEDVALELGIQPNISPEGTIVMAVVLRKAKLGTEVAVGAQGARMTTIDNAEVKTMVSAANNETVILGGLITKDENKLRRKVPFLGDIPILGKFFRHELDQTIRKELLVILTPRIVKDHGDLEQVKQMEYARMSWCLNNVVQVYGDIGAYSVVSDRPYTGDAPIMTPGPVKMEDLEPILAPTLPTPMLPRRE